MRRLKQICATPYGQTLVIVCGLILIVWYGYQFFAPGIEVNGNFYRRFLTDHYQSRQGSLLREEEGDSTIITHQLGLTTHVYVVEHLGTNQVRVTEEQPPNRTYEGHYNRSGYYAYDGEDPSYLFFTNNHSSDRSMLSLITVLETTFNHNRVIRGDFTPIFLALFTALLVFLDIKYPRLYFNLDHFLVVKNPEPTELYLFLRKVRIAVLSMMVIVFFIVALF